MDNLAHDSSQGRSPSPTLSWSFHPFARAALEGRSPPRLWSTLAARRWRGKETGANLFQMLGQVPLEPSGDHVEQTPFGGCAGGVSRRVVNVMRRLFSQELAFLAFGSLQTQIFPSFLGGYSGGPPSHSVRGTTWHDLMSLRPRCLSSRVGCGREGARGGDALLLWGSRQW